MIGIFHGITGIDTKIPAEMDGRQAPTTARLLPSAQSWEENQWMLSIKQPLKVQDGAPPVMFVGL
jgi:hypothetical protein